MPLERLQKIISAAGITSRRKAEELISSGHVSVNGEVVSQLGAKADEQSQQAISDAVERLAGPDAMGDLFKVLKILPKTGKTA